ncbi:MAG: FlgD immunoglobulin-like domain containing protein [bacterium]
MRIALETPSRFGKAQVFAVVVTACVLLASNGARAQTLVLETADASAIDGAWYTSLALDASGNPHVSYQDQTTDDLKYARKSGGVWTIETADGSANLVGAHTSLALDASGNPHVSYQDRTTEDLKYARKSGGVWTIETADASANFVGYYTSLALDASGNPHVCYQNQTTGDVKYARKSGGVWTIETADASANFVGEYTSLALDASGNPHVSYLDGTTFDVKYARKSAGVWTIETADGSANDAGFFTSLALDASGNPHVSYHDDTTGDLKYARKSGGVWTIETADGSTIEVGSYTSLALDASGNPHVSYIDDTILDLKYARKSGGVWTRETADGSANNVGYFTSLALDASGNPHVSYLDDTTGDLKYAYIPSVLISSPQPGVTWPVGSEQTIRWSFTGGLPIANSHVYLSVDGGNSFTQIRNEARDPGMTLRVPHTPSRFASIKIIRPSPYTEAYMDSFFTIDAAITLNKFDARLVGDDEFGGNAKGARLGVNGGGGSRGPANAGAGGVALTWETTPGREADIRYRIERAAADDASSVFAPLTVEPLDANEFLDASADAASGSGASASGARYRLIAINGLGEEYALGETLIAPRLGAGRLLAVSPNPSAGGNVSIAFRAAQAGLQTDVSIYDLSGRRVRTIASGSFALGVQSALWDGRDESGGRVAAGAYFARLAWNGVANATERITIVK